MLYLVIVKRIQYKPTPFEYFRTCLVKMKGNRLMLKSELRKIAAEHFNVVENFVTVL
jgi:hypothetical protein